MAWSNGLAEWIDSDTAYLSVVFSWRLPDAYARASFYKQQGYLVRAGGPGTWMLPDYLKDVAMVDPLGNIDALIHHNPLATIASRACPGMGTEENPKPCTFCIVPKMWGTKFILLPDFIPRPILCDDNLSALPIRYQEHIIEKYRKFNVPLQDCNSGFEPFTFDEDTFRRWGEIYNGTWRFGYDTLKERDNVFRMFRILKNVPARRKRVYVLIGLEPFAECYQRVREVIEWGGEPHCQPFMDLNTLVKRARPRFDWTEQKLTNMTRWANRWIWRHVRFEDYNPSYHTPVDRTSQLELMVDV